MMQGLWKCVVVSFLFIFFSPIAHSLEAEQSKESVMNNDKMDEVIRRLDDKAEGENGYWVFKIATLSVTVVTDEKADRMRIIIPIIESEKLDEATLYRVMQANFDSALDARYAIAKNILWSAYIHPLASLNEEQFITAIGQTVNLVSSFGTTYSSGLLSFRGGDSRAIQQKELIQELLDKGRSI
ncbi:MAG: type III secretion system chaperone [Gammaproteobacteria bacterium]